MRPGTIVLTTNLACATLFGALVWQVSPSGATWYIVGATVAIAHSQVSCAANVPPTGGG